MEAHSTYVGGMVTLLGTVLLLLSRVEHCSEASDVFDRLGTLLVGAGAALVFIPPGLIYAQTHAAAAVIGGSIFCVLVASVAFFPDRTRRIFGTPLSSAFLKRGERRKDGKDDRPGEDSQDRPAEEVLKGGQRQRNRP